MTAPAPFALRKSSRYALLSAPFVIAAGLWATPGLMVYDAIKDAPPAPTAAAVPEGRALFVRHCASCHGVNGDGKGVANLNPPARAFGYEPFKFATTTNQMPSDDDIRRLVRKGIPGSSMPAFTPDELPDGALDTVIARVRELALRGVYRATDEREGADLEPADIQKRSVEAVRVGPPYPRQAVPPATDALIERGRQVFLTEKAGCVSCHGSDGRGAMRPAKNGTQVAIRDLTSGVFKSGGEPEDLYVRLRLGIPGHPESGISMVPVDKSIPDADVFALIHYVRSLKGQ